jgi:hypothetical protein
MLQGVFGAPEAAMDIQHNGKAVLVLRESEAKIDELVGVRPVRNAKIAGRSGF